jgi:CDP-diacylglycerol--glycerol-3-phosphate 3-phosphatidyltransferase
MGKLLDPMADKLLSATGIILIAISNILPAWGFCVMAFVILGRDFSVDTLRMVAAKKGVVVAANWSGKIRTIVAMVAMPYLMFMSTKIFDNYYFNFIGFCLIGLAVILCAYSWFFYFWKNRKVLKSGREM